MTSTDPTVSLKRLSTSIAQLSSRVETFKEDVCDAQQDMDDLSVKLESLEECIAKLEEKFEDSAAQYADRQKRRLKNLIDDCDRIAKEMNALLKSLMSSGEDAEKLWTAIPKDLLGKLQNDLEDDRVAIVLTLERKRAVILEPNRINENPGWNQDRESMISTSQSFLETANVPYSFQDPNARPGEVPRQFTQRKPSSDSTGTPSSNARMSTNFGIHDRRNTQDNTAVITESPLDLRGSWHQSGTMRPGAHPESPNTTPANIQNAPPPYPKLESQFRPQEALSIKHPSETLLNIGRQIPDDWTTRQLLPDDRPFEQRHEGNGDKEVVQPNVPSNASIRSHQTLQSISEASVRDLTYVQLEKGELDEIAMTRAARARGRLSDSDTDKKDKELLRKVKEGAEIIKIEALLDNGADPNAAGPRNTVLTTEIQYKGRQQVIELLLRRGAEPNATSDGIPRHRILEGGNMERLKSKMGVGGSIDAVPCRIGVLYLAALHTNIEVVKLLISYGAAPRPHTDPMVSLSRSISPGNKNSKRPSIDRKDSSSTPTKGHRSAILVAAEKDKWDIVELLAKQGADPNEKGEKSETTLQLATIMNRKDIMQILIKRGADVNLQGGRYGFALIAAAFEGHPTAAKILLDAGARINLQSSPYGTALNAAVLNGYLNVVKFLLERGADTQPGYALDTALQRLKDDPENNNRRAIVRILESYGAKPGPSDGKTPQWAGLFAATY
jgi:ankyrin repeat protein